MQKNNTLIRHNILIQLEAASPASLPIETITQGLSYAGHDDDHRAALKHLDYLVQKKFVAPSINQVSPANQRFKLSARGKDYLETQGLA